MRINGVRFQATSYDSREIETSYLSHDELRALDLSQWDHAYAAPLGVFAFRGADGTHVTRSLTSCGLGPIAWSLIQAVQWEPGVYLAPAEIAEGTGVDSFRENEIIAARLAAIRKAHQENGQAPRLFLSQRAPYGVAWSPSATWIWLQRVSPRNGDKAQSADPNE